VYPRFEELNDTDDASNEMLIVAWESLSRIVFRHGHSQHTVCVIQSPPRTGACIDLVHRSPKSQSL